MKESTKRGGESRPFIRREFVNVTEGLALAGFDTSERVLRGRLMMKGARSNNGLGLRKRTHWAFTRRYTDGHVITALGRIAGARVTKIGGEVAFVEFYLEGEEKA
jgi:hypothetical protein